MTVKQRISTASQQRKNSEEQEYGHKHLEKQIDCEHEYMKHHSSAKKHIIGHDRQASPWTRNKYIVRGYRVGFNSSKKIFKSLFMMHNESINIWSHLGGAMIIVIVIIYLALTLYSFDYAHFQNYISAHIDPIKQELVEYDGTLQSKLEQYKHKYTEMTYLVRERYDELKNDLQELSHKFSYQGLEEIIDDVRTFIDHSEIKQKFKKNFRRYEQILVGLRDKLVHQLDDDGEYGRYVDMGLAMGDMSYQRVKNIHNEVSRWPLFVFLFTAFLCLSCSSIFHLFCALGHTANKVLLRLDYAGVCFLIVGTTFPIYWYGFHCNKVWGWYWLIQLVIISTIVFFVSLCDFIHTEKYLKLKSIMYGGLGIFAAVPIIHLVIIENFSKGDDYSTLPSIAYYIAMGASYLGGLAIYTYRCPERYKPGQYDYCGASHQLWHFSILVAIVMSYFGSLVNYYNRRLNSHCPV